MLINRNNLDILLGIFNRIGDIRFDITTQYKLLKLKKIIEEENEIYLTQLESLKTFFSKDENGNFIKNEEGGYAIDPDKTEDCRKAIDEINALQIQVPDTYFSLDELKPLDLTFNELEALDMFIK